MRPGLGQFYLVRGYHPVKPRPAGSLHGFGRHRLREPLQRPCPCGDASGKLVPALAEHWEVSPDRRTYTFTLKSGLTYTATKGAATDYAITAEDFVFAFRRMFRADTASPYAVEFSAIENSAAVLSGQLPETALGVQARGDATPCVLPERAGREFSLQAHPCPVPCPATRTFFNSTRGTYGLSAASTLSSGSFYLYNWTASGLFLRREPSGNRVDSLRLVQNTGASGQSAAPAHCQ